MSQPLPENERSPRTALVRSQFTRFRRARQQGMFGLAEIAGLSVGALVLLLVAVSYFYFLVPAQNRRESLGRERARLQTLLRSSHDVMRKDEDTKAIVERITGSIEDFEARRLTQHAQGRMDLYDELNGLIKRNGLRNTSGPTYTSLEAAGSQSGKKSTSTKWQSVYPGISAALTVEGQYQNLRHFIRDLEASKQFIIINGVELERATEANAAASAEATPAAPRSSLVSLRLDLSTYFQRTLAEGAAANGE